MPKRHARDFRRAVCERVVAEDKLEAPSPDRRGRAKGIEADELGDGRVRRASLSALLLTVS